MRDAAFRDTLSWEEKARRNPLWAVMSVPEFEELGPDPEQWTAAQLQLFFAKGRALRDSYLEPPLRRLGAVPGEVRVLEYGSGMGRLLNAFAERGYRCTGVDISPTMLEHSRRLVPAVTDLHLVGGDGAIPVPATSMDYVYSYAVLQHISRRSHVRRAVSEMCRVLRPGGLLRLQFQATSVPLRRARSSVIRAVNFERHSLVYRWARLQRRLGVPDWVPPVPLVYLHRHGNWAGVPFRWGAMESLLNGRGVRVYGLEVDVAAEWNSVWLLGKKGA